jgi:ABC-type branched-subunit amino acid transport system ATPase component
MKEGFNFGSRSVITMLKGLKNDGVSMLLVEQNVEMALELVDRVLILDQGSIVYAGTPAHLRHNTEVQTAYLGLGDKGLARDPHAGEAIRMPRA